MIIVKLIGGLGNQMFQYAAAKRLAEKHSTIVKLDISAFEKYKLHRYSLHCFQASEYLATQAEVAEIKGKSKRILNQISIKLRSKFDFKEPKMCGLITENYFHFNPEILNTQNNVFLDGYWQSEKYFSDITDILRREFVVKYQQEVQSQKFADLIQNTNSVSLHVRRADYIQNTLTNKIHGTCDQNYYNRCVGYLANQTTKPHFFVFSDEPQWAKDNLRFDHPVTIVDCNDASRNYEDLRLMSMCKHNIIANSSFSWWGGWLNTNPYKLVIAPKKWFNDETRNTEDLVPSHWIKM